MRPAPPTPGSRRRSASRRPTTRSRSRTRRGRDGRRSRARPRSSRHSPTTTARSPSAWRRSSETAPSTPRRTSSWPGSSRRRSTRCRVVQRHRRRGKLVGRSWSSTCRSTTRSSSDLEPFAALDDGDRFVFVADGERDRAELDPRAARGSASAAGLHQRRRLERTGRSAPTCSPPSRASTARRSRSSRSARSPRSTQAVSDLRSRFLLFSAVAMVAVGILAYTFGRTIVRSLGELAAAAAGGIAKGKPRPAGPGARARRVRRPRRGLQRHGRPARAAPAGARRRARPRSRLRSPASATRSRRRTTRTRFCPVIVTNTVEATGAAGARLVVDGKEIASEGDPDAGGPPLAIPLGLDGRESGVLYLTPREADFSDEARELAHWLGSQASIALENARLHRLVERQANTDGLTELPNRRHFEEALEVGDLACRALRRQPRPDPRRPRRLQAGERPLRPPGRRRRPPDVRGHPAGDRARDRPSRPLRR